MLLESETLVSREVTLVSRVNRWCADQEMFFFRVKCSDAGARKKHWCRWSNVGARIRIHIFSLEESSYVALKSKLRSFVLGHTLGRLLGGTRF